MNLREAAQLAMDFIVDTNKNSSFWLVPASNLNKTVTALRAALAEEAMQRLTDVQQEMEKTHTSVDNEYTPVEPVAWVRVDRGHIDFHKHPDYLPLYTTLPQHKPLTDVQQEMKPTIKDNLTVKSWAWNEYPIDTDTTRGPMLMTVGDTLSRAGFIKKQEPLSIETINKLWNDAVGWGDASSNEVTFVRAIERAHGIGGEG
jgi:hypothetical protein